MTDKEIIKALECCFVKENCESCLMDKSGSKCMNKIGKNAFDLINHLQARVENWKKAFYNLDKIAQPTVEYVKKEKFEAIKDFAEKLKEKALLVEIADYEYAVLVEDIDSLVKEMTEETDNGKV